MKEINVIHYQSVFAVKEKPEITEPNYNIERIVFNEQQYDAFVKEFWKQSDFLINRGFTPRTVIISLEDYKNLLAFEQTTSVNMYLGLPIVVDRFANHNVKVLPSPKDQMALYHFIKKETVGQR